MGFFGDSFDDCIKKFEKCDDEGDYPGAEAALLKAIQKKHDDDYNGSLYYVLSLVQFNQDKNDLAFSNMQYSANLGYQDAIDFVLEVNEDDDIDWASIAKNARDILGSVASLVNLLSE